MRKGRSEQSKIPQKHHLWWLKYNEVVTPSTKDRAATKGSRVPWKYKGVGWSCMETGRVVWKYKGTGWSCMETGSKLNNRED